MQANRVQISRAALIVAGFAAGVITRALAGSHQAGEIAALKSSLSETEGRVARQREEWEERFRNMESRVDDHELRLNEVPSTGQIVSAIEDLLAKNMASLNQRLSAQSGSIDLLKTTVAQTDALLERVLESLDSLRESAEPDSTSTERG
jgi:uncharacterized coiled-coil protein SlyX